MNKIRIDHIKKRGESLIFVIALGLVLNACATSHRDRLAEEARELNATNYNLEAEFTSEEISQEKLGAFEIRAQQKLQDFADYVNLVADTAIDSILRQQAVRQSLSLFAESSTPVSIDAGQQSVEVFLTSRMTASEEKHIFTVQDIQVREHLQPISAHQYEGWLSFQQQASEESQPWISRQARMIVEKVEKKFGSEKEQVWEVFLGEIK